MAANSCQSLARVEKVAGRREFILWEDKMASQLMMCRKASFVAMAASSVRRESLDVLFVRGFVLAVCDVVPYVSLLSVCCRFTQAADYCS